MVTKFRLFFAVVCLLFPSLCSAADYVTHVIKKGENVSKIVLKLTGSNNYLKDGIVVAIIVNGKDTGRVRPKEELGVVYPGWEVRIKTDFAKTEPVKGSAGKTFAQVCKGSSDLRCAQKLALLNGNITSKMSKRDIASRLSKTLTDDVYALPGMLAASTVSAQVPVQVPVVAKVETPQPTKAPAAPAPAEVPVPPPAVAAPRVTPASAADKPPDKPPSAATAAADQPAAVAADQPAAVAADQAASSSSNSSPPTALIYIIAAAAIVGVIVLGIAWHLYIKKARADNALQAGLADIRLEELRELKGRVQEFVSRFEMFFKHYLNANANSVEILPEYLPWNGKGVIRIVPQKGNYPNLTNHKVDLDCDLAKFNETFPNEPFTFKEPFVDDKPGVCVPFVHAGGDL